MKVQENTSKFNPLVEEEGGGGGGGIFPLEDMHPGVSQLPEIIHRAPNHGITV